MVPESNELGGKGGSPRAVPEEERSAGAGTVPVVHLFRISFIHLFIRSYILAGLRSFQMHSGRL